MQVSQIWSMLSKFIFILLMIFGFVLLFLGLLAWEICSKSLPGKLKTIHIFFWILKVSFKNLKMMIKTFHFIAC